MTNTYSPQTSKGARDQAADTYDKAADLGRRAADGGRRGRGPETR